ncbi:hypothetical protein [Virgibacillus sp. SK37]|uniref:hypothetical protein n=1 Tax=Virgibacillus sp. SK37 TaxID=403957 RepID=UPI0004D18DFC|nr:hypothetical protein [Virgibacillus sp. SK37]AIF45635.1 hypothetical protein X953_18760 [Virgibacillus sp. SK37]
MSVKENLMLAMVNLGQIGAKEILSILMFVIVFGTIFMLIGYMYNRFIKPKLSDKQQTIFKPIFTYFVLMVFGIGIVSMFM